jgi:hypothetical protein
MLSLQYSQRFSRSLAHNHHASPQCLYPSTKLHSPERIPPHLSKSSLLAFHPARVKQLHSREQPLIYRLGAEGWVRLLLGIFLA